MDSLDDILQFANRHRDDDPVALLLQKSRHPGIDLGLVAQQLEGRRQARDKWPSLATNDNYFYPPRLNREQSSSETTARYKAAIAARLQPDTLADLTGGMGVDISFMASHCRQADYFELDTELCAIAEHNFRHLGLDNIACHNTDSLAHLAAHDCHYSLLYIDPARRDNRGRRVAAFEDCTPDLTANLPLLQQCSDRLLVKASPMIDLHLAIAQLAEVAEVHIVAVDNECKEILFLSGEAAEPLIHCANITAAGTDLTTFTPSTENEARPHFAADAATYLYEPNAALMKGGCHNLVGQQYNLHKLARNTHLYTSDTLVADFPGRIFEILQPLPLNAKAVRQALPGGKAHVVTRNYPTSAADLQRQLKLREGGDLFVVAATLGTRPQGWLCRRVAPTPPAPHSSSVAESEASTKHQRSIDEARTKVGRTDFGTNATSSPYYEG